LGVWRREDSEEEKVELEKEEEREGELEESASESNEKDLSSPSLGTDMRLSLAVASHSSGSSLKDGSPSEKEGSLRVRGARLEKERRLDLVKIGVSGQSLWAVGMVRVKGGG